MTAAVLLPTGEPLLVRDVLVGGALSTGPAVMVVLIGETADGEQLTAALQWIRAEEAERHLEAMLADVRSRIPLPPVVQLPLQTRPVQP